MASANIQKTFLPTSARASSGCEEHPEQFNATHLSLRANTLGTHTVVINEIYQFRIGEGLFLKIKIQSQHTHSFRFSFKK